MEFPKVRNQVGGNWIEGDTEDRAPLYNPSTGEQIGEVPLSSEKASVAAVEAAEAAYRSWRKMPIGSRVSCLFEMRRLVLEHSEDLAVVIATDQGKHISEARGEVARVAQILEAACAMPILLQGETLEGISAEVGGRVVRQSLGVFGGVAPFNFPALVFAWFVPYAVGTGNTMVFKPSTQSPLFMQRMGRLLEETGLPAGVVNLVHGNRTVVEPWYEHPAVSGICLVGSTPTAKEMAARCGRGGKRSMLLGGAKNWLVVLEDADLDLFADQFVNSCFGSAGQRCLAGSVVAAVPAVYDRCLEVMVEAARKVKVGNALDPEVYMGPVISASAKSRIERYIEVGVEEGSTLVLDGRDPPVADPGGYYVGPTIFSEVTPCRRICREEIFGPVVSAVRIEDMDDALGLIEKQDFGNGACVFTRSLYYAERFVSEADVGMVGVNVGVCAPHPYLPFGGIKESHLGSDKVQGGVGIDFFTQRKVATVRVSPPGGSVAGDIAAKSRAVRSCVAS